MSKYTFGTWKVDQWHGKIGQMFIVGIRNNKPCIIAGELYDENNEPTLGELKDNACLIASAPDLLRALQEIKDEVLHAQGTKAKNLLEVWQINGQHILNIADKALRSLKE